MRRRAALLLGSGTVWRHDWVVAPALALLDVLQGPLVSLGLHLHVTLLGTSWSWSSLGLRLGVGLRGHLGVVRGRVHGRALSGRHIAGPVVLLTTPLAHPITPAVMLLLLLGPSVLLIALTTSTRIPLLLLLLLTISMLLAVARLEPLLLLLLLLLVVVDLIVAGLAGSVARVEAVVGVSGLELSRHGLVTSTALRRIHPALERESYSSGSSAIVTESHLVLVPSLLARLLHEPSLSPHSLLVERLSLTSLQVTEAPVSGELTSHSEVPVKRSHWVRHPPALGVLHLHRAHLGHGGVPPVHEAAAHEITGHGHRAVTLEITRVVTSTSCRRLVTARPEIGPNCAVRTNGYDHYLG